MKIAFSILVALVIGSTSWAWRQTVQNSSSAQKAEQQRAAIDAVQKSLDAKQAIAAELEGQLDKMTQALSNQTVKLATARQDFESARQQLEAIQLAQKATDSEKLARQKLADDCPAIKEGQKVIFPRLLSKSSSVLMTNAEFRVVVGRRLTFRNAADLNSFDIDAVHPGVLIQLNIAPDIAKSKQAELDRKDAAWAAEQAKNAKLLAAQEAERAKREAIENEKNAKIYAEQYKEWEKEQFDRSLKVQAVNNDTLRAQASMKNANAALISAMNPY